MNLIIFCDEKEMQKNYMQKIHSNINKYFDVIKNYFEFNELSLFENLLAQIVSKT